MSVRSRTVWRDGKRFAEYANGELVWLASDYEPNDKRSDLAAPMVMRDIGEYRSPIDNSMVTSRSAHREHLKTHGVVEVGNERMASPAPPAPDTRPIGEAVKRRIEEVQALPQKVYDAQVQVQQAEHAAIADLVVAS